MQYATLTSAPASQELDVLTTFGNPWAISPFGTSCKPHTAYSRTCRWCSHQFHIPGGNRACPKGRGWYQLPECAQHELWPSSLAAPETPMGWPYPFTVRSTQLSDLNRGFLWPGLSSRRGGRMSQESLQSRETFSHAGPCGEAVTADRGQKPTRHTRHRAPRPREAPAPRPNGRGPSRGLPPAGPRGSTARPHRLPRGLPGLGPTRGPGCGRSSPAAPAAGPPGRRHRPRGAPPPSLPHLSAAAAAASASGPGPPPPPPSRGLAAAPPRFSNTASARAGAAPARAGPPTASAS